jgi:hypothetical protein
MEIVTNFWAILAAVVCNFILGWIWYGPLFGKIWAKEMKRDLSATPDKKAMLKGMILMIIGNFLMAFVLSHDIFVWLKFPGMDKMSPLETAWMSSFFIWLGYYVPTHIGATTWEQKSWKLTFINLAYHLSSLFVAAYFISTMPK